ncbi:MAG: hypothetical protein Ct9H90mP14_3150 [Methanobacteriota archaeon]|nr:MAG: hypothetical protein Ct9H90mP14_3150 [Euryarchaeota archaeon]
MGDPLHNKLLDEFGIQVPVFPFGPHHEMRYFPIFAYLYNLLKSMNTCRNFARNSLNYYFHEYMNRSS